MRKKLFTLLLAIVASVGTLFAASGTCGDNLTWNLTDNVLTISGSGAMTDYAYNSTSPWDSYSSSIETVIIGDDVTTIGDRAFYDCDGLTSVTIPNSVTSIGDYAFEYCSGLTSITIPESVTTIGDYAFSECDGLTSLTIPNSVTSIGEGNFSGCSGLTSVTIPNSVTSIGDYAFEYCSGLTSITIPESVTTIGDYAFSECDGLTSLTIPNSVTSIGDYAFSECDGLTSLTIPNSVTSIGSSAFSGCRGLTSVTIPNSVTSIGDYAFSECDGLTSLTIPNSVTSIGDYAFYDIPNIVYNGTAEGSPWGAKTINGYVDGYLVYSDDTKTTLTACSTSVQGDIVIPNSVTNIGEYAFYDCDGLTSVTIPNSVTTIGDYAFSECDGLTSLTIPNSVTSIGSSAFSGCRGLTSITIPNSVTSIGESAFHGVLNVIYNGTAEGSPWGAKTINGYVDGYLVYSDAAKTTVMACSTLAQGNIVIPNSVTTIGAEAFFGCGGLTSVTIPNSVTSIGGGAFWCSSLTSINIPESIKSIEERTFSGCGLTDIVLPSSLETIGEWAFAQNTICDWLGLDCTPLIKTITCYSQLPPSVHSNDGEYDSFEESLTDDVIIYVPADYLNTYKAHDFWGMHDVRPLNEIATGIEDIFSNGGSQSSQPQKVLIDGKMYIALPNGHLYDATGKQVE